MLPPSTTQPESGHDLAAIDEPPVGPGAPRGNGGWYRRMSRRSRRWFWATVVVATLLGSLTGAAALVRVPYWSYSPGAMRDTSGIVRVGGLETEPIEGRIAFTTVSIRGRLTVLRFVADWLDPNAEILAEESVLGTRDPDENRQINLQLMDMSTQTASYVALARLGHEVSRTGTGAIIAQVEAGQPADGVIDPGDTIVAVNGTPIEVAEDLVAAISGRPPGTVVTISVNPLGTPDIDEREVTLGARDDDPTQAFLGVWPQTRDLAYRWPEGVTIDFVTNGVSGPSAGLAFTLALLDLLAPGSLTGGLNVAATGTINEQGVIGNIGGLEQKAIGARQEGYDVLFVPATTPEHELAAAHRRAGDELLVIEVATLDEALAALEDLGGDPLPSP